jgi:hypothetical protein
MNKVEIINNFLQTGSTNILVGSTEWFAWLAQNDSFRYKGTSGHFTAQREMRRNKTFWYAYRRRDRKLWQALPGKIRRANLRAPRAGQPGAVWEIIL